MKKYQYFCSTLQICSVSDIPILCHTEISTISQSFDRFFGSNIEILYNCMSLGPALLIFTVNHIISSSVVLFGSSMFLFTTPLSALPVYCQCLLLSANCSQHLVC